MAKSKGISDRPHPLAPRAAPVEPHAAHRRGPERRSAHRRRADRRGHLPPQRPRLRDRRRDQPPPVHRAAGLHRGGRDRVRARQLRGGRALPCARSEDPWRSNRLTPTSSPVRSTPPLAVEEPPDEVFEKRRIGVLAWIGIGWLGVRRARSRSSRRCCRSSRRRLGDYVHPQAGHVLARAHPRQRRLRPRRAQPRDLGRRASLLIALGSVVFGTLIGGFLGLIAGFKGGRHRHGAERLLQHLPGVPAAGARADPRLGARAGQAGRRRARPVNGRHRIGVVILAIGIVSIPLARPHHARERALVVAARVRDGRARAGRDRTGASCSARCCRTSFPRCCRSRCSASAIVIVLEGALAVFGVERPGARRRRGAT